MWKTRETGEGEAQILIQNKISRPEGRSGRLEEEKREQSVWNV